MADRVPANKIDLIVKHTEALKKISMSWQKAIETGKDVIEKDFIKKRLALKQNLNKQRERQLELINSQQKTNAQITADFNKLFIQMSSDLSSADTTVAGIRRKQQIDQIFCDTQNEVSVAIEGHKEKVRRMEQLIIQEKQQTFSLGLATTDTGIQNTVNDLNKNLAEIFNQLNANTNEMAKKIQDLADIDKKEVEELIKIEKNCLESEDKDRKEEMAKFIANIKGVSTLR